jgi:hypothetical protein
MVARLKRTIPLPLRRVGRNVLSSAERMALDAGVLPGTPPPVRRVDRFAELPSDSGCHVIALDPRPLEGHSGEVQALGTPIPGFLDDEVPGGVPSPSVALLDRGVVLSGDGLVATSGGQIVLESVWRRARRLRGAYGSLVTPWGSNHFHWLIDGLPRLALLEEAGFGGLPLLVSGPIDAVRREMLELAGADAEAAVGVDAHPVSPDLLVWAAPLSWTAHPLSWTCSWLRDRLTVDVPSGGPRGIYISRAKAPCRRVENEVDLIRELKHFGVEAVCLEGMPFREQVALFARARFVVAPHGAGLANLVFGTRLNVVEIFPRRWAGPVYARLALASGHRYAYLIGDAGSSRAGEPALDDMVVPIEPVARWVESQVDGGDIPAKERAPQS